MLRFIALSLLCLQGFWLAAEPVDGFICDAQSLNGILKEPQSGLMYESARINDIFDQCTRDRARDKSEDYLYTWGYAPKLQRMLNSERFEFCGHDQARIQTVVALHKNTAQGNNRNSILDSVLHDITRDYFSIPSESYYPLIQATPLSKLKAVFEKQLEDCDGNLRCRAQIEGRLAGLNQFNPKGFANTATRGHGVYFGNDPISFLSHKYTDDHIGLVCDISSSNLSITDLGNEQTEATLEKWLVSIPGAGKETDIPQGLREQAIITRVLYPYYNIPAYEIAGHKRILRFHGSSTIYLDKCAIEYRASCEILSVENLKSCQDIKQLSNIFDELLNNPQAITNSHLKENYAKLGYYLIQQGGYRNTEHLLEAIEDRRKLRCPKKKKKRKKRR